MEKTVGLFVELANGYSSVRTMRKSETAKSIISNHNEDSFPFLGVTNQSRNRTLFYFAITKTLLAGEGELSDSEFSSFVQPFTLKLNNLMSIQDVYVLKQPQVQVCHCFIHFSGCH
jgi:exportin-7